ncbi:hypothetical protein TNCV_5087251 [Trichonephila clavipes]|nr:hypothetical protein TNCV_5087251 [Trichonephila clavipes]
MVDNESGTEIADLTINLICCDPKSTATIMVLKSATVHSLLASSNGHIALAHVRSDSPICPTYLFQSNYTASFKLTVARNELVSCGEAFFLLLKGMLSCNATEIWTNRLRIASYRHLLSAQFQCTVAPAIHSLDTKY